jgi:hypothetical protein
MGGWVGGEAQPVVVTTELFDKHEISEFHVEAAIVRHRKGGHFRLTDRLLKGNAELPVEEQHKIDVRITVGGCQLLCPRNTSLVAASVQLVPLLGVEMAHPSAFDA